MLIRVLDMLGLHTLCNVPECAEGAMGNGTKFLQISSAREWPSLG